MCRGRNGILAQNYAAMENGGCHRGIGGDPREYLPRVNISTEYAQAAKRSRQRQKAAEGNLSGSRNQKEQREMAEAIAAQKAAREQLVFFRSMSFT